MKVTFGIGKIKKRFKKPILAIGVFDGLHLGHQALISKAIDRAKVLKRDVCVLTFWPHPLHIVRPSLKLPLIISLSHRISVLEQMGIDECIVARFTKKFSEMSAGSFIKRYLVDKINPQEIFVGTDFRFGHNRSGSLEYFKKLGDSRGFVINIVNPVPAVKKKMGVEKISSTLIRNFIAEGNIKGAARLLGRPVSVMGKVRQGDSRGKKLGFPTANLGIKNELLPPGGVYAVEIIFGDKKYKGMANIGSRPSFKKEKSSYILEVNIFDFNQNLYDKVIMVVFVKYIREEKTFLCRNDLIAQLHKDEVRVRKLLVI